MVNIKEDSKLNILNHSCAHLLAQAVKHLYPNAKFWVGPVIDDGFYYDIDLEGKDAVVIGRSHIVGQPVYKLLLQKNASVTILH